MMIYIDYNFLIFIKMLSSLTGALSKLKETKIAQKVSSNYQKLKNQINKKIEIVEVFPRLYHISYP